MLSNEHPDRWQWWKQFLKSLEKNHCEQPNLKSKRKWKTDWNCQNEANYSVSSKITLKMTFVTLQKGCITIRETKCSRIACYCGMCCVQTLLQKHAEAVFCLAGHSNYLTFQMQEQSQKLENVRRECGCGTMYYKSSVFCILNSGLWTILFFICT